MLGNINAWYCVQVSGHEISSAYLHLGHTEDACRMAKGAYCKGVSGKITREKFSKICENGMENVGLFRAGFQAMDCLQYFLKTPLHYQTE
jgi:hypothetical protein